MAASVFFYRLGNDLVQATLTSLEQEMMKNKELQTTIQNGLSSTSNGDGIIQSMHSLKEMLQSLMKLPNWEFASALPTLLTKDKELK
jgi:ethanolamine ammonia-lyase small subunit